HDKHQALADAIWRQASAPTRKPMTDLVPIHDWTIAKRCLKNGRALPSGAGLCAWNSRRPTSVCNVRKRTTLYMSPRTVNVASREVPRGEKRCARIPQQDGPVRHGETFLTGTTESWL